MARCSEATLPGAHRLGKPGRRSGGNDDSELDVFSAERYFNGDNDALWCPRSSSSSFSSAFRTGTTHDHDRPVATATAATSSSEASWNSRSVLLPGGKVLAVAAATTAPSVEAAEFRRGTGSEQRPRENPTALPTSSHLRRWLLGVAGCACCIGGDDGDDNSCRDEVEGLYTVAGVGGKKLVTDGAGELFQGTESKQLAFVEATATSLNLKARPRRCHDDGEQFAGDGHRQAVKSGEFFAPIFNPATTTAALSHEQRRRSSEMIDTRGALASTQQGSAAFTIVAANTACGGTVHADADAGRREGRSAKPLVRPAGTSRCGWSEDDDVSAPIELVVGCAYPPSEASIDWSVVTAEGAASDNFSSAASGYYYLDSAVRHAAGRSNGSRRCGVTKNAGSLLTCMGDKAVDAVGPARSLGLFHRPDDVKPGTMGGRLGPHCDGRNSVGYPDVMHRR